MKMKKSLDFIVLDDNVPSRVLMHSAAVIVCRVGQYDSGSEDMMTVL